MEATNPSRVGLPGAKPALERRGIHVEEYDLVCSGGWLEPLPRLINPVTDQLVLGSANPHMLSTNLSTLLGLFEVGVNK